MGTQKIKLDYFLRKSKVSLKDFCEKNNLKSYDELVDYCLSKNFISVTELVYKDSVPAKDLKEVVNKIIKKETNVDLPKTEKKVRKRRSRKKSSDSKSGNINSWIKSWRILFCFNFWVS